jgi:thiamine-phosphate pyrophosphorylase
VVGADAVVGLSTHTADQLRAALDEPVDYVAVGAVFATSMMPAGHPTVGLDFVRAAAVATASRGLPFVAIGGIRLDTALAVLEAGASAVAVISDLLVGDPRERARSYLKVVGELTL